MGAAPSSFVFASGREPHAARAKEILRAHADIRKLAGRNPWSGVLIVALVAIQTALAWLLSGQPVWVILVAAWVVGAFASHALWVLIDDSAHNLVVKSGPWNKVFAMTANLPHLFPTAVSFQKYHLKHHAFQGVYDLDADLPNRGRRVSSGTPHRERPSGSSSSRSSSSPGLRG